MSYCFFTYKDFSEVFKCKLTCLFIYILYTYFMSSSPEQTIFVNNIKVFVNNIKICVNNIQIFVNDMNIFVNNNNEPYVLV